MSPARIQCSISHNIHGKKVRNKEKGFVYLHTHIHTEILFNIKEGGSIMICDNNTVVNLEDTVLSKTSQTQKDKTYIYYLHEESRIIKLIYVQCRMVVSRARVTEETRDMRLFHLNKMSKS